MMLLLKRSLDDDENIKFHVPFLPNIFGESPIHKFIDLEDYKSVDSLIKFLSIYPSDHHSRAIKDKYGEMVKQQLPCFLEYLDTRI